MRIRTLVAAATVAVILAAVFARVRAQEPADPAAQMQEWMKLASPSEHHKFLDPFVGEWDVTMKVFMGGPGSPAMESKGTASLRWVLGGRFILEEYKGTLMGQPYEGMGMTGYDNGKNLYVSTWANTMDTQLLVMSGSRNPQTGIFTYYGAMDEPMMKVFGRTIRYETKILDEDAHQVAVYDLHVSDDTKVVELVYKRKKK